MPRPDPSDRAHAHPSRSLPAAVWAFVLALSIGLLSLSGHACLRLAGDVPSRVAASAELDLASGAAMGFESYAAVVRGEPVPDACTREAPAAEAAGVALDPAEQQPSHLAPPAPVPLVLHADLMPREPAPAGPLLLPLLRPPRA